MACCGQKQTEWNPREWNTPSRSASEHSAVTGSGGVMLKYVEDSPILVRGSSTGRHYQFSGVSPVQEVDVRDAVAMLRTGYFRRQ
jgi:hypothetical protein